MPENQTKPNQSRIIICNHLYVFKQLFLFSVPVVHRGKIKENKKERKILWSCQRAEKAVEHEGDIDTNCSWCPWNCLLKRRLGELEPEHSPVKTRENTSKSSGDLRKLAVTQTSVKNHQLKLVRKTYIEWK